MGGGCAFNFTYEVTIRSNKVFGLLGIYILHLIIMSTIITMTSHIHKLSYTL